MAHDSGLVDITQGFHIFQPTSLPVHVLNPMPSKDQRQRVWMVEEKLTDVQLDLTVYWDALRGGVDQVVMCSNDSDVEPALKLVRQDATDVRIGLVMPLRPDAKGQGGVLNKRLTAQATWVRHHILDAELAASQLPPHVTTKKMQASKRIGSEFFRGQQMPEALSDRLVQQGVICGRRCCLSDRDRMMDSIQATGMQGGSSTRFKCLSVLDFPVNTES